MTANGKITGDDLKLARAVRKLAPPGGSVTVGLLAANLGTTFQAAVRRVDAAERHGIASRYTYMGAAYVSLSDQGWALTQPATERKGS